MAGKHYDISAGPRDPEYITIKAKKCIIAYPVRALGEKSTALNIVKGAVDLTGRRIEELLSKMGPHPSVMESNCRDATEKTATMVTDNRC
ncbi:MAG: hypothetical protein FWG96_01790 [Methanomassiliicoccaceae archaeon]|nr:hypothetical protein [Methanomassiliicoccaceae archaeon]